MTLQCTVGSQPLRGASGGLRCLESGHGFVYTCSFLGIGFIGFIRVFQRSLVPKKESLKGVHCEGKEQEDKDKSGVTYIRLTYCKRDLPLTSESSPRVPSRDFPPSFYRSSGLSVSFWEAELCSCSFLSYRFLLLILSLHIHTHNLSEMSRSKYV